MRVHNKNNAENKMVSAFCGMQNKDDKAILCPPQKKNMTNHLRIMIKFILKEVCECCT